MKECLTSCSHPQVQARGEALLLVQAFPAEKMRWISAPSNVAQAGSGWRWATRKDSTPGPQLSPPLPLAIPTSFCHIFKSRGGICIPGSGAEFLLHAFNDLVWVCVGTLGWGLFPWSGCPWLLDHPGGHWPILDETQVSVCWEEKGPQSLANFSHAGHRTAVC